MTSQIESIYGNKVRVRVSGLCWEDENLLLVCHKGLSSVGFWAPPGGGVEFGESMENTLKREFLEETGLVIETGAFRFGCEFIQRPLHAIEVFFEVFRTGGILKRGTDPELQIIEEVRFINVFELERFSSNQLHGIFQFAKTSAEFSKLEGFYRI